MTPINRLYTSVAYSHELDKLKEKYKKQGYICKEVHKKYTSQRRQMVFIKKGFPVIKISNDPAYKQFIEVAVRYQNHNKHFPAIYAYEEHVDRLPGYYLVIMEELQPLTVEEYKNDIGFHCYCIRHFPDATVITFKRYIESTYSAATIRNNSDLWEQQNYYFALALLTISRCMGRYKEDLKKDNIMKRKDGTWVIIDPYTVFGAGVW